MTPSEFEKMQREFSKTNETTMTLSDLEFVEDMMGNEVLSDEKIVYSNDGVGITETGAIALTNKLDIQYVQARIKQTVERHRKAQMKSKFTLIKG